MTESEAIAIMKSPKDRRPNIWLGGVLQIWITRACDKSCFGCTQGSNLAGKPGMITLDQFETACQSLKGYFGVIGMFGGNCCLHPQFDDLCAIMRKYIPAEQRGIWSNHPKGKAAACRATFNPAVSNLNVHLDQEAYDEFATGWPECRQYIKGLGQDSRHSPPFVAMQDVDELEMPDGRILENTEANRWELISTCDVNRLWSSMIYVFRGQLRASFCELAAAQAMLHANDPGYPDTGHEVVPGWWNKSLEAFREQVRFHCHACGHPLRGFGELAIGGHTEQVSKTHADIYIPKQRGREVQIVTLRSELGEKVQKATAYIENGSLG